MSNVPADKNTVQTYVAFLRAINVGGRLVKMASLAEHFHALGHTEVKTFINTGNVVFRSPLASPDALALSLESELEPLLGFKSEAFVRSAQELRAIVERARTYTPQVPPEGEINVALLKQPLSPEQWSRLQTLRTGVDDFAHDGSEVYWLCRVRQSESKFSNALFERKLAVRSTLRRASMLERLSIQLRDRAMYA